MLPINKDHCKLCKNILNGKWQVSPGLGRTNLQLCSICFGKLHPLHPGCVLDRETLAKVIDDAYPPHMSNGLQYVVADAILSAAFVNVFGLTKQHKASSTRIAGASGVFHWGRVAADRVKHMAPERITPTLGLVAGSLLLALGYTIQSPGTALHGVLFLLCAGACEAIRGFTSWFLYGRWSAPVLMRLRLHL